MSTPALSTPTSDSTRTTFDVATTLDSGTVADASQLSPIDQALANAGMDVVASFALVSSDTAVADASIGTVGTAAALAAKTGGTVTFNIPLNSAPTPTSGGFDPAKLRSDFPPNALDVLNHLFAPEGDTHFVSDDRLRDAKQTLSQYWDLPEGLMNADGSNLRFEKAGETTALGEDGTFRFSLGKFRFELNVNDEPRISANDIKTVLDGSQPIRTVRHDALQLGPKYQARLEAHGHDVAETQAFLLSALSDWGDASKVSDAQVAQVKALLVEMDPMFAEAESFTLDHHNNTALDAGKSVHGKMVKDGEEWGFVTNMEKGHTIRMSSPWQAEFAQPA